MIIFGGSNCIQFLVDDDNLTTPRFWKYNFMNRVNLGTPINTLFPPKQITDLYRIDMMYSVEFDKLYMNYILSCDDAFISFMNILMGQYYGNNSFVLINDDELISNFVEALIKLILVRYGMNCSIVNDPSDIPYVVESEMSPLGLQTFMMDKERFTYLTTDGDQLLRNNIEMEDYNGTFI